MARSCPAVAVGDRRAIVADRDAARPGQAEAERRLGDVGLRRDAGALPQQAGKGRKVSLAAHAAARSARKPVSGVENGG